MSPQFQPEHAVLRSQVASALRPRFIEARQVAPAPEWPTLGVLASNRVMAGAAPPLAMAAGAPEVPGAAPTSAFVLSRSEWIDLQVGMANLDRIALTMRNAGGELAGLAGEAERLARLWRETAFPALRLAAVRIRDFGQGVLDVKPRVLNRGLRLLFEMLTRAAGDAHQQAQTVYGYIQQLELGCSRLRADVDAVHKLYLSRAENTTAETKRLREQLTGLVEGLPERQARYHHYVTVAATTVTYGWIPLFGWIAGGAVAGTYGRAAVLEKEAIDADVGSIADITRTLSGAEHQIAILARASVGLAGMGRCFNRVLPVLQHTQGIWASIGSDLSAVFGRLETASDPDQFAAVVEFEYQIVVEGWREVAVHAAEFLKYAEVAAPADPAPFGNFRTRTRYGNQTHEEQHILGIDLFGVAVNGIPVQSPGFEGQRVHWGPQTDASRRDKPWTADIRFTADAFEGVCTFPMEGPIGWIGTRM